MLIGGFSALFLLSRGLSIPEIAYLKGFQAIVILIADIPFGYFADRYSKKISVFLGIFFGSLWMFATAYSPNILWIYTGEFFNAISLALFNGAFQAILIENFKKEYPRKELKFLMGNFGKYNFFFMSLAVLIGGASLSTNSSFFWWLGASLLLISSFLFLLMSPKADKPDKQRKILNDFIKIRNFLSVKYQPILICYVAVSMIGGFFYQNFIQYWQVIISKTISTENALFYSIIFFVILISQSLSGEVAKNFYKLNDKVSNIFLILNFIVMISGILQNNVYAVIASIISFFFFYRVMAILISSYTNEILDDDIRATFIAVESSMMRLALFIISPLIGFAISKWGMIFIPIQGFVIFILSISILFLINKLQAKPKKQEFFE